MTVGRMTRTHTPVHRQRDWAGDCPPHHRCEAPPRAQAGHLAPVHGIAGVLDHRLRPVHRRVGETHDAPCPVLHRAAHPPSAQRRRHARAANLAWATQIARNLSEAREDRAEPIRFLVHDREKRFGATFDEVFKAEGIEILRTRWRVPKANAYAERWIRTVRAECLDRVMVFGRRHLEQLLRTYVKYYHEERPHRSRGLEPPGGPQPLRALSPASREIAGRDRLGGLIHEYCREAA